MLIDVARESPVETRRRTVETASIVEVLVEQFPLLGGFNDDGIQLRSTTAPVLLHST